VSTQSTENVRDLLHHGGVFGRDLEPALKPCQRFLVAAGGGQQRSEFEQAADRPVRLFLSGWLFPTDASINVAIGQAREFKVVPPYIEVADGTAGWKSSTLPIAFPTGKNKTVIVDLPEGLPAGDPRMRIRTNMEIYWDEAFYQIVDDESQVALLNRRLSPDFQTKFDNVFYLRPTNKNAKVAPNLAANGVTNDADSTDGLWIPDWNWYIDNEAEITDVSNEIFSG